MSGVNAAGLTDTGGLVALRISTRGMFSFAADTVEIPAVRVPIEADAIILPAARSPADADTVVLPAVRPPAEAETMVLPAARTPADDEAVGITPDPTAEVTALVERAQAGDAEAFGQIYDRYVETIFRFICFRVGNRQVAEDLTADTFLRALRRIGSFTWQGRDLRAWLVTIARNLVADYYKSGRHRLEVTTGDLLGVDRVERVSEDGPEDAVVGHIANIALLRAVKQLNPEQQECIVLRFLQDFSVAETAEVMGKSTGAIKALQYRAVRSLARILPAELDPKRQ